MTEKEVEAPVEKAVELETLASSEDVGASGKVPSKAESQVHINSIVFNQPVDHLGTELYVKGYINQNTNMPPVIFVHDLGETSTDYRDAVKGLAVRGFSSFIFDQRGHGRSGQILGHIGKFDELVEDLLQVVNWVQYKSQRRKPYIVAFGLGALALTHFLQRNPNRCQGCIFVSPRMIDRTSALHRSLIHMMAEMVPRLRVPLRLTPRVLMGARARFAFSSKFASEMLSGFQSLCALPLDLDMPLHTLTEETAEGEVLRAAVERVIRNTSSDVTFDHLEPESGMDIPMASALSSIENWLYTQIED